MQRSEALAEIRRLETIINDQGNEIVNLRRELESQGIEVQTVARASMEVRAEDVGQLAAYQEQNTRLIQFVEKIADSKSKFGQEARKLLGI